MTRFFLAIYDFLNRHRWMTVLLLVAMIALCVLLSLRLNYKENIADFLPTNPENERYSAVYNGLGDQGKITILFRSETEVEDEAKLELAEAVDLLEETWENSESLQSITLRCKMDDDEVFEAIDFMRDHFVLFLTEADYQRMDSLLAQPGYVAQCMQNIHGMLSFPMSAMATEAIVNDPLNLYSPVLQRMSRLSASDNYVMEDGYLYSQDGKCAFAFAESPYETSDTRNNAALSKEIDSVLSQTMAENPNVRVSAVGAPLIAATNATQIKKDSFVSIALAIVLIMVVLLFAVGYKRNLLWMGLSIVFGWLFALAAIALFRPSVSIIVVGIGSVLVGIAVNYPLHFLDHIRHETDKRSALKEMVEPLVVGNITTVSAFACLVFVNADAMRDLGLFGALMLVGTILFSMIFLPQFAKSGVRREKRVNEANWTNWSTWANWSNWTNWGRKLFFVFVILLTIVFGILSTRTTFDSNLHNINYMTDQQREDLALLSSSVESNDAEKLLYVVAEGKTLDEALEHNEALLEQVRQVGVPDSNISGVSGILPSQNRQRQSLEMWQDFKARHPQVVQDLQREQLRNGFNKGAFDVFVQRWESDYQVLENQDVTLGANYILQSDSGVYVVNFVKTSADMAAEVKQRQFAGFAFDESDVGNNLVQMLSDNFNYILYVCGFVVFFFLCLSFGSLELALLAFLPLTVGWLWILGIMDVWGVQFNIVNIILATFIFGQGDDYTIFITEGLMYENAYGRKRLKSYTRSVILSAILMFVGMGTLIVARHPAMKSLAEVAIIGMAVVVLMACYLPPLVYRWMVYKNGQKRQFPITLKRLWRSFVSLLVAGVFMVVIFTPFAIVYWLVVPESEQKRLRYHRYIQSYTSKALRCIPGVQSSVKIAEGEDFSKPAMIVANHQSSLDLLCILMLAPNIAIMTNKRVWNNPLYSLIIHKAEFYPTSDGYETNIERQKDLIRRGYCVMVFPEGSRSADGKLGRFHRGAFQMAKDLGVDILPVYIHGVGDVMPKNDLLLREGAVYVEVGERIPAESITEKDAKQVASETRKLMVERYAEICREQQNEDYYLPLVRHQYLYKGRDIERRARKTLRGLSGLRLQDNQIDENNVCRMVDDCQGERSLLLALAHPDVTFEVTFRNEDDALVAGNCAAKPGNMRIEN